MNVENKINHKIESTPKRCRLGLRKKPLKLTQVSIKNKLRQNSTPRLRSTSVNVDKICDSPPIPCNQELSAIDGEVSDSILCSPGIFDSEELNFGTFETSGKYNIADIEENNIAVIEEINDDMFKTALEPKCIEIDNILTSRCEKLFRDEIEESFDLLNHSITNINNNNNDKSCFFETRDSFLLDIRESGIIADNLKCVAKSSVDHVRNTNSFYGLPMIVKGLFKSYRNIEKFYDWQEECLNLDAIKLRRNLIYALPTSGGKTLVAEVLMLREVLNRRRNALFILPFVAIVQEKIWSLGPFALQLEFLVEEYAAGKGLIPPKKRRKKNSIYVATIEKGLALVRSLIDLNRLNEIGLIVVDELHLIGEAGRGSTLETLLTTVIFANQGIQIVGMSATIGNLPDIARFLKADVFEKQFRPVELTEYVKLGDVLHKIVWDSGVDIVPDRQLKFDYSSEGTSLDPDYLGGLVSEVVPHSSCLIFCPTKKNCENVAALLCKVQRREMTNHRLTERMALSAALRAEGAGELTRCVRFGVAYHHAGLAADERALLEHAFRSGVISVLCCTSTLAAGVNLPARRVIVRAPLVGRDFISLGAYKQMVGRAGRAGVCEEGESIIICSAREWPQLRRTLSSGLPPARSSLRRSAGSLLLSAVALKLATRKCDLKRLLDTTFMAVSPDDTDSPVDIDEVCQESIQSLVESGALDTLVARADYADDHTELAVSVLGRAAIKGCMELSTAKQLLSDLELASRSLVVMDSLHLLYLVTPHDTSVRPDYRHYYSLYCELDEEGIQTAKVLGITEMNAIRMMTGKPIINVPENVLSRFYLALMLRDLWRQMPFPAVADKYCVPRGTVQSIMATASSFSSSAHKICEELQLWGFKALFEELTVRLRHCAAPEIEQLMELPAVKKGRALQLVRAGYKRVQDLAKASAEELTANVTYLSRSAADHLISAARVMLIEKVENLRAEAEDVMEELNM